MTLLPGDAAGIALGTIVLVSFPVAVLTFVFFIVRRRVISGESVVRW